MDYQDKTLICKDCGKDFLWTAREQEFYAQKGFENAPARCPECRKKNRERRKQKEPKYEIVCAECRKRDKVHFQPRDPSDVLCSDCWQKKKDAERASNKAAA